MNFILKRKAKYYTKRAAQLVLITIIGILIVGAILVVKFKPAYKVTLAGEVVGFVDSKAEEQRRINDYINNTEGNIAFIAVEELPSYDWTLISRSEQTKEDEILELVKKSAEITYRTYAISVDGEEQFEVASEEEASNVIASVTEDVIEGVDLDFGINKVYTQKLELSDSETAIAALTEIKDEKVAEYQAELARQAAARAAAAAAASSGSYSGYTSTATLASAGSISGLNLITPVSGMISSRFGSRGSGRSTTHTGLDIATSMGTPFRAAAGGTVIFAGYSGSYGNLIKISHGNGIETWYAHCHSIWVDVGEKVSQGEQIGCVGSTGNSTGPHLHFEIRSGGTPLNPQNYLY